MTKAQARPSWARRHALAAVGNARGCLATTVQEEPCAAEYMGGRAADRCGGPLWLGLGLPAREIPRGKPLTVVPRTTPEHTRTDISNANLAQGRRFIAKPAPRAQKRAS